MKKPQLLEKKNSSRLNMEGFCANMKHVSQLQSLWKRERIKGSPSHQLSCETQKYYCTDVIDVFITFCRIIIVSSFIDSSFLTATQITFNEYKH